MRAGYLSLLEGRYAFERRMREEHGVRTGLQKLVTAEAFYDLPRVLSDRVFEAILDG